MGSLFGKKSGAPTAGRTPRRRPTMDELVPAVTREVDDRNVPMKAPEVNLREKLPPEIGEALEARLAAGARALLLDPEEAETRYFAVFEDHLEELGRSPVADHGERLGLIDFCQGGAITVGALRYRLEMFKSFNEFGDRLTVQFFEEGKLGPEQVIEGRHANIRLVNRLKPATSLTARNENDLYDVVRRNPRDKGFVEVLLEEGAIERERLDQIPPGEDYELRVLQGHIYPRKVAAKALAHYLGADYVDVEEVPFSKEAARLLEKEWELQRQFVPFQQEGQELRVAMMDPTDVALIAEIEERSGMKVRPYCSAAQDVMVMIHKGHKRDD